MKYMQCQCGERSLYTSMGAQPCQGCEKCGTNFAYGPDGHKPLEPHKLVTRYNENTGRPYKACSRCFYIDEESFAKARKPNKKDEEPEEKP